MWPPEAVPACAAGAGAVGGALLALLHRQSLLKYAASTAASCAIFMTSFSSAYYEARPGRPLTCTRLASTRQCCSWPDPRMPCSSPLAQTVLLQHSRLALLADRARLLPSCSAAWRAQSSAIIETSGIRSQDLERTWQQAVQ